MTATAAPDAPQTRVPERGRPPIIARTVWGLAAFTALVLTAAAAGTWWSPARDGLPDAGWLVVNGLPVLRLVTLLAGGTMVGFGAVRGGTGSRGPHQADPGRSP